jgi:uncharacterized membrane protein
MKEDKKVLVILLITFLIQVGVFHLFFPSFSKSGSYYKEIKINYQDLGNSVEVNENFDIVVRDTWNVIYRSFNEKICFNSQCNVIIKDLNCKLGIPYISLKDGTLFMKKNGEWKKISKSSLKYANKIYKNEVGCYNENGYFGEEEILNLKYDFPRSYLRKFNYVHAFFTEEHPPIEKLKTERDLKEKIAKDAPILINTKTQKIEIKDYKNLLIALLFALDSIIYLIWFFFGKDKEFLVPKYLHRKPINPEINKEEDYFTYALLYNGGDINKDMLTALLFSLKLKGLLEKVKKKGVLIKSFLFYFNKDAFDKLEQLKLNKYEKSFIQLLEKEGIRKEENGKVVYEIELNDHKRRALYRFFHGELNKPIKNRFEKKANNLVGLLWFFALVSIIIIASSNINNFLRSQLALTLTIWLITSLIALGILKKELIRFKGSFYKEYLEIEAFRNFLNDYAQLKKYFPEDEVIWKDWLLIATALGVADNVLKVLNERGYNISELLDYEEMRSVSSTFYAAAIASSSSSGSGGGFGGGAGGGGGGGR